MYYYFNPNYKLIKDENKVILLTRYSYARKNPEFEADLQFQSYIHPVYASFISFFNGDELDTIYNKISQNYDIGVDLVKGSLSNLIENTEQLYIDFDGSSLVFPKNTIIKSNKKISDYDIPDFDTFLDMEEVDLLSARTNKPIDLTLMLNTNCYTNCAYCYADRRVKMECRISFERISELVKEAKELNMRGFDLIGGEVLLYKDWYKLTKLLKDNDFEPFISTKLPIKKKEIEQIESLNLPDLQFSLDTISSCTFSTLLRINGEKYKKDIETMFKTLSEHQISLSVHTILSKENCNIQNLEQLYEYLKKQKITTWKIDYVQKSFFTSEDFNNIKVSVEQVLSTFDYLKSIASNEKGFKIEYSDITAQKQNGLKKNRNDFLFDEARSCPANVSSFFILPDGNVTICEQFYWEKEYIIGNVNEQSLLEIWNSKKALELYNRRKNITNPKSPCNNCNDAEMCFSNSMVCFRDVVFSYGFNNWDYPDPRCHNALQPIFDLQ
jgi:radical SAM protein with 4Fe4S-binding SPASM domain